MSSSSLPELVSSSTAACAGARGWMPADEVSTSSMKGEPVAGRSSQATAMTSAELGASGVFRESSLGGERGVVAFLAGFFATLAGAEVVFAALARVGVAFAALAGADIVFAALARAEVVFAALARAEVVFAALLRVATFFVALLRVALFFAGAFRAAPFFVAVFFGVEARRDDFFAALDLRFFVAMGDSSWAARIVALSRCGSAAPCVLVLASPPTRARVPGQRRGGPHPTSLEARRGGLPTLARLPVRHQVAWHPAPFDSPEFKALASGTRSRMTHLLRRPLDTLEPWRTNC